MSFVYERNKTIHVTPNVTNLRGMIVNQSASFYYTNEKNIKSSHTFTAFETNINVHNINRQLYFVDILL